MQTELNCRYCRTNVNVKPQYSKFINKTQYALIKVLSPKQFPLQISQVFTFHTLSAVHEKYHKYLDIKMVKENASTDISKICILNASTRNCSNKKS